MAHPDFIDDQMRALNQRMKLKKRRRDFLLRRIDPTLLRFIDKDVFKKVASSGIIGRVVSGKGKPFPTFDRFRTISTEPISPITIVTEPPIIDFTRTDT